MNNGQMGKAKQKWLKGVKPRCLHQWRVEGNPEHQVHLLHLRRLRKKRGNLQSQIEKQRRSESRHPNLPPRKVRRTLPVNLQTLTRETVPVVAALLRRVQKIRQGLPPPGRRQDRKEENSLLSEKKSLQATNSHLCEEREEAGPRTVLQSQITGRVKLHRRERPTEERTGSVCQYFFPGVWSKDQDVKAAAQTEIVAAPPVQWHGGTAQEVWHLQDAGAHEAGHRVAELSLPDGPARPVNRRLAITQSQGIVQRGFPSVVRGIPEVPRQDLGRQDNSVRPAGLRLVGGGWLHPSVTHPAVQHHGEDAFQTDHHLAKAGH